VDEISHLRDWEPALNEVLALPKVKVILFSSTREVLSERIDLVREGRCGVVDMLPLSLSEFLFFHGFREIDRNEPVSNVKLYRGPDDKTFTLGEIYRTYVSVGGMPVV
jgi:predicted AAA+ superfamily ATPase